MEERELHINLFCRLHTLETKHGVPLHLLSFASYERGQAGGRLV